ncbi:MAG: hypothetical protein KIT57_14075 [Blastocatellales bacterium]|nr:hypothetical protein [Blastocatellales bacterium]
MSDWYKDAAEKVKDYWHTPYGLIGLILGICAILIPAFASFDITAISIIEWAVIAVIILIGCAVWWFMHIPRVPKGKIGIGVAIAYENTEQAKTLRADFVNALKDLLLQSELRHKFYFVELPSALADQLDDRTRAGNVARRCKLMFMIYGRSRLRTMPEGAAYVLDLSGLVIHTLVDEWTQRQFGEDFNRVFPRRLIVASNNSLLECEFEAKRIDAVARYIIGVAFALGTYFENAETILLDVEARLKRLIDEQKEALLSVLYSQTRQRLTEIYHGWLAILMNTYIVKRDQSMLSQAEIVVRRLREYDSDSYRAHQSAATAAFVLRRDKQTAMKEIRACKSINDAGWQYSEAFLHAYDGDLDSAYRSYRNAFDAPMEDPTFATQCEEFIQMILDEEPDRHWLYFCLGLINFRAKRDLIAAQKDFQYFIDRANQGRFNTQINVIKEKWLPEIERELSSTLYKNEK